METLKPRIKRVEGRCYRASPVEPLPGWSEEDYDNQEYHNTNFSCNVDTEAPPCDLAIFETEKGFQLIMDVPSAFFGLIIGKRAETKKKIERETETQILIPRVGSEIDEITLLSGQKRNLVSAKTRIDVICDSGRQKMKFTHFLSFPVNSQTIQNGFLDFKEDVLRYCDGTPGLDESIFQLPAKLHMTITTLVLLNQKEVSKATELLNQCQQEVINPLLDGQPLVVYVKGLEYMNDDPSKVRVSYAKVNVKDNSNKLQMIADELMHRFREAGLAHIDFDRVKLHTTMLNAKFRKFAAREMVDERYRDYDSFDIRPIMEAYSEYNFGEHHINSVHISQKGSYDESGFYLSAGSISLP